MFVNFCTVSLTVFLHKLMNRMLCKVRLFDALFTFKKICKCFVNVNATFALCSMVEIMFASKRLHANVILT